MVGLSPPGKKARNSAAQTAQPGVRRCALGMALGLALLGGPAAAAGSPWISEPMVQTRLVAATAALAGDGTAELGLQIRLEPGWKVYWRQAGAAGVPTSLDWSRSVNLAPPAVAWPRPHRTSVDGLDSFVYEGEVVIPVTVRAAGAGPVQARLAVEFGVCREICVPLRHEHRLELPRGAAVPTPFAALIDRYRALVPRPFAAAGLAVEAAGRQDRALHLTIRSAVPFAAPDLLVEAADGAAFGRPSVTLSADRRRADLSLAAARPLAAEPLRLTLLDGKRAAETEIVLTD